MAGQRYEKDPFLQHGFSEPAPSRQLIGRLFMRYMTSQEEIAQLQVGTRVKLMAIADGEEDLIGHVVKTEGRDIVVMPATRVVIDNNYFQHNIPVKNPDPITAPVYFLTRDPFDSGGLDPVDQHDPTVKWAVRSALPNRMHVSQNGFDHLGFSINDPELDIILKEILDQFPVIRTAADVAALTASIHTDIPYKEYQDPRKDGVHKLGTIINEYGAECRDLAAVAIGVAILGIDKDKDPKISYVSNKGSKPSHGYMAIEEGLEDQTEPILSDPTFNVSGTSTEVLLKLLGRSYSLKSHLPENATSYQFEPDWAALP
jgi:hypothetical protein